MNLVFFGSGAFGLPTLERLVREHAVDLVVSQPDRPAGRKRVLTPTPVSAFATAHDLQLVTPETVNEPEATAKIRGVGADAFVVIAYGQKLGDALLDGVFAVNLHGSLLPKYRGAAPINRAMINGETETGVTVITVGPRMDAGAVLAGCRTPIDPRETAGELHDRLSALGPTLMLDALDRFAAGRLAPVEQDEALATRAPKIGRADARVDFAAPADVVRARINGLSPWPGCTVACGGEQGKLLRAETIDVSVDDATGPGSGPSRSAPGSIGTDGVIACSVGAVRLLEVQPAGGRAMSFEDYCRGRDVPAGTRFESP